MEVGVRSVGLWWGGREAEGREEGCVGESMRMRTRMQMLGWRLG